MNRFERHRGLTLTILLIVGAVVVLALVEATLRLTGGVATDRAGLGRYITLREWPPNKNLTFTAPRTRATLAEDGATRSYRLQTDADGFIKPGRLYSQPDLTIAFLGGSTTEALFVDADKRFHVVAERELQAKTGLKVNALNGGRSGNNVTHANQILNAKLLALHPDYVVLMEAINDLGVLMRFGTYWPDDRDFGQVQRFRQSFGEGVRMVRDALIPETTLAIRKASQVIRGSMRAHAQSTTAMEASIAAASRSYESALRQFVLTCRAWDIKPVLMTQALYSADGARGAGLEGDYLNPAQLAKLAQTPESIARIHAHLNAILRRVAQELDVPVIDLARDLPQDPRLFYDGMHYGNRGSVAAGELIAARFAEIVAKDRRP